MIAPVQRRRTFSDFRREGVRVRQGAIRLNYLAPEWLPAGSAKPQLAFAIGRRFGNAVVRNRGRRRLRAAFTEAWTSSGLDRQDSLAGAFLVTGSPAVLTAPFIQLVADVDACFDQVLVKIRSAR